MNEQAIKALETLRRAIMEGGTNNCWAVYEAVRRALRNLSAASATPTPEPEPEVGPPGGEYQLGDFVAINCGSHPKCQVACTVPDSNGDWYLKSSDGVGIIVSRSSLQFLCRPPMVRGQVAKTGHASGRVGVVRGVEQEKGGEEHICMAVAGEDIGWYHREELVPLTLPES